MTEHDLKTWPEHWQAVADGVKTFELRVNDRGYQVGDVLHLREWHPTTSLYSGRSCRRRVTHLLVGGQFGLADGHVIMSLQPEHGTVRNQVHGSVTGGVFQAGNITGPVSFR